MFRDFERSLGKGEIYIGLGGSRALHILPNGKVRSEGLSGELPPEAYFMLPLVTKVVPQEFLGPGDFTKIQELEERLGNFTGRPEDIYERVGPFLASKGVTTGRVAKVLLEMSPIKIMKDTGQISKDAYNGYELSLVYKITEYYPGSARSKKEREKIIKTARDTGKRKHKGSDGISF
jgi:hypothetical protein